MEIERKYLVSGIPDNIDSYPCRFIEQGYLNTAPVVRVRRDNDNYYLTYKGGGMMAREEYNLPLNKEAYEHLIKKADGNIITKKRYEIPDGNGYTIELDIFEGLFAGTILAEVELNIPAPTNWLKLTSSGILTYRKSDNRLYYFYYWKETDGLTNIDQQEPNFHTAIINPSTMEVEKDVLSPIECEMAGSAYGELMQNCVMYDEADNLYLACFHEEDNAFFKGILLRINKGETEFDASYNGYPNADGKLLTIQYLEGNKALVYARNDNADRPAADKQPGIDAYSHYYAILDLTTGTKTRLSYDGKEIGYSGGRFSQRSVIFNNKAYIGVNTEEDANAVIYIYDIKTGNVEKGAEVDGRFYFDMIRVIEND